MLENQTFAHNVDFFNDISLNKDARSLISFKDVWLEKKPALRAKVWFSSIIIKEDIVGNIYVFP